MNDACQLDDRSARPIGYDRGAKPKYASACVDRQNCEKGDPVIAGLFQAILILAFVAMSLGLGAEGHAGVGPIHRRRRVLLL